MQLKSNDFFLLAHQMTTMERTQSTSQSTYPACIVMKWLTFELLFSKDTVTETVFLNADTVNKPSKRNCPGDLDLREGRLRADMAR